MQIRKVLTNGLNLYPRGLEEHTQPTINKGKETVKISSEIGDTVIKINVEGRK